MLLVRITGGVFHSNLADMKQVQHSLLKPWHDDGWEEQDGSGEHGSGDGSVSHSLCRGEGTVLEYSAHSRYKQRFPLSKVGDMCTYAMRWAQTQYQSYTQEGMSGYIGFILRGKCKHKTQVGCNSEVARGESLTLLAAMREVPTTLPSSSTTSTPSTSSCRRISRTLITLAVAGTCVWGVCECMRGGVCV